MTTQQILLPKKVYIGDSAELRITFTSSQEILSCNLDGTLDFKTYMIKDVHFEKSGLNYYQVSIEFIPWRTGNIQLPNVKLIFATEQTADGTTIEAPDSSLLIKTEPVNIVSLVEQNQVTSIRGIKNPMLVPGTTYKLYSSIIVFIIILIILIRVIIKHKQIALFLKNQKLLRKYRRNKKATFKSLAKLTEANSPKVMDKVFAAEIQKIMRNYLEVRFEYPFSKTVSSEIVKTFSIATCDLASEKKMEAIEKIAGIFIRTDYLRYGAANRDNSNYENLSDDERLEIIESLKTSIETLEYIPPKKSEIVLPDGKILSAEAVKTTGENNV